MLAYIAAPLGSVMAMGFYIFLDLAAIAAFPNVKIDLYLRIQMLR